MFNIKDKRKLKTMKSMARLNTKSDYFFPEHYINKKQKTTIKKAKIFLNRTNTFWEKEIINPTEISNNNQINYNIKPIKHRTSIVTNIKRQMNNKNSNSYFLNNISNLKTQGNSAININNISEKTASDNIIEKNHSKNSINFKDRLKLKAIKVLGLKLYEQFEEDKRKIKSVSKNNISDNNLIRINNSFDNTDDEDKKNSILDNIIIPKKKKYKNKRNVPYSLKQLIQLNPYHYVSTRVRYNNAIAMEKISEKLSNVNSVKPNQKITSKNNFFKNNLNQKIIKTVKVQFNNNLSYLGGLIWRILSKLQKNNVGSEFREICKFQGYTELWKYYGMLIEKLILNYPIFKWFLEKEKLMGEAVFKEYLQCLKIDINNDESFPRKVFLIFDDYGEGKINIKLFFFVMKLTSSTSDIDKLNFFMKLFEDVNRKDMELCINVLEMFDILKKIINYNGWEKIKNNLLKNIKKELNNDKILSKDNYISKNKMVNFFLNNKLYNKIIKNFMREYKYAYINYNEKINSIFFNTVRNVKKFLNEQNEVTTNVCSHMVNNYEKILEIVESKNEKKEQLNEINNYIEGKDE